MEHVYMYIYYGYIEIYATLTKKNLSYFNLIVEVFL